MPASRPRLGSALAILLLAGAPAAAAPPAAEEAARRAVHLLDYVARDYGGAVEGGQVVDAFEYEEQREFVEQVGAQLEALGVPPGDVLATDLAALDAAVRARAPEQQVSESARELGAALRERFGVRALPPRTPSPERGRALYAEACASCHGAAGRGDGPAGGGLSPPPADLGDPARMAPLSPFAIYNTVSFGIAGSGMLPLAERYGDAERWDVAFFVSSLAASEAELERGRVLVERAPERAAVHVPSLEALVERAPAELEGEAADVAAFLRVHPEMLAGRSLPLAIARSRLEASRAAAAAGDADRAVALSVSAYLDGFEPLEPALTAVDPTLRSEIEAGFLRYRSALRAGAGAKEVEALHAELEAALARAESRLGGGGLGPRTVFVSSLTILAREGLEAVLLVVALVGVLVRAGRRDALPWVHAGWAGALAAGAATWWAARRLVDLSGARREVVEGVSALVATAILFYVSYWLLSKIEAARWQAFLDGRIRSALTRGRLGALAMVSFVAVYRECFETVLFYQALAAQAGPAGARPLAAGIGAGTVLLAGLALAVFRFGQRMPVRHFFAASSLLLYALAIVLAGHGVAALQEAGWLPATWLPLVRFEWLGIHPTAEGLAVQGALALAALAALPRLVGGLRQPTAAGG